MKKYELSYIVILGQLWHKFFFKKKLLNFSEKNSIECRKS
jgi:hypothetical protein